MRILGIDPSTRSLGLALYDSTQDRLLWTNTHRLAAPDVDDRCNDLDRDLLRLIPDGMDVDAIAIERMFSTGNAADAPLAVVSWLIRRRARRLGVVCVSVSRKTACKAATGSGASDKRAVQRALADRFGWRTCNTDESDAAAVAIAAAVELEKGAA